MVSKVNLIQVWCSNLICFFLYFVWKSSLILSAPSLPLVCLFFFAVVVSKLSFFLKLPIQYQVFTLLILPSL